MDIVLHNKRPLWELIVLPSIFVLCGFLGIWQLMPLIGLPEAPTAILSACVSLLWLGAGFAVFRKAVASDGRLTLQPAKETFVLNGATYPYQALNYYSSSLIAPRIGLAPNYSSQHIEIGVNKSIFKMGDDVAVKHLTPEKLNQLSILIQKSSLTSEQKNSFQNWLERVQIIGNHTTQTPEDTEA